MIGGVPFANAYAAEEEDYPIASSTDALLNGSNTTTTYVDQTGKYKYKILDTDSVEIKDYLVSKLSNIICLITHSELS